MQMFLNYFERVLKQTPNGMLTIQRQICLKYPDFKNSKTKLSKLSVYFDGTIEDRKAELQVDFANKFIGGGVICGGCVQEEIRFSVCPELISSCLFCEVMGENEAIFLIG